MDENYIDVVRKSLNRDSQNKLDNCQVMPRKSKKIKFSVNHYNSETVFASPKSEKFQDRKCTPFKKKDSKKKKSTQNGDSSFEGDTTLDNSRPNLKNRKPTPFKNTHENKLPKKRKVVISFGSNESSEEDLKNALIPSKSEIDLSKSKLKKHKSTKKKRKVSFDVSNDSEESTSEFNLHDYFNSCDINLDESITDTHSGIEYEFVSECCVGGRIISSELSISQDDEEEHFQQDTNHDASVTEDLVEIPDSDISDNDVEYVSNESNENVLTVSNELQKSMTLQGEQDNETVISFDNSPRSSVNSLLQDEECFESDPAGYSLEYDFEDWKLVILKGYKANRFVSGVFVHGLFTLKVLYGKVEIFGHILDEHSKEVNVYSPRGSALLKIKAVTKVESNETYELSKILPNVTFDNNVNGFRVEQSGAVIKCTRLDDARMSLIEKYISQQIFPVGNNKNFLRVVLDPREDWNIFQKCDRWDKILGSMEPSSKLLLAGGKSVGKSTFLRFAINSLLNKFHEIRVIDLDPGQSEFAVSGSVSIVSITEPVLGPNYTHLRATDRSLLSNINVGYDPDAYIKCVKYLMAYSETLQECPTLINFMGFAQGIGLNILSSAITYIQPTDVVQINSSYSNKNYRVDISPISVQEHCNMFASNSAPLDFKCHIIPAMNDSNEGWALEPRQSREMCVLAYLGGMMSNSINSLTSHELPMYEVKLSSVKITNLRGEEISPSIANANLVALCALEAESNIYRCFGYGIVRGIDLYAQSLVLLTPERPDVLEEVYYLVVGSVNLPPSVYMTPDDVRGSIPYVMKGELVSLGQITKRSYLPVNKK